MIKQLDDHPTTGEVAAKVRVLVREVNLLTEAPGEQADYTVTLAIFAGSLDSEQRQQFMRSHEIVCAYIKMAYTKAQVRTTPTELYDFLEAMQDMEADDAQATT